MQVWGALPDYRSQFDHAFSIALTFIQSSECT